MREVREEREREAWIDMGLRREGKVERERWWEKPREGRERSRVSGR